MIIDFKNLLFGEKKMNEKISKVEKVKEVKKDILSLSKENRIVLFLLESENKNKEEINKLYLEKYNLSERSNNFNERVINRFLGENSKWSKEKKELKKKLVKESLIKVNLDFNKLVLLNERVKKEMRRSNKLSNFKEIELFNL